ncbi:MAG: FKBP-type peptidyl-prolyl cis-trans isomerase [Planctomycetota bacterium]|nr:FKBP-type peptidyl-prolyl cis-trans isomerase [Planctomycetota bacterium]
MTTRVFPKTTALFASFVLATAMTACEKSKPEIDPKGPQPPSSSNEEVNSAQATPDNSAMPTSVAASTPHFDATSLPGMRATKWTNTPGGSWYATVMPGRGTDIIDDGNTTVTVSLSMWTEDGTPVLLTEETGEDMIVPLGDDMFAGWNETLVGMRVGETRKIAIPWDQSLGQDGQGLVQCEDGSQDQQMLVGDIRLIAIDAVTQAPDMPLISTGS